MYDLIVVCLKPVKRGYYIPTISFHFPRNPFVGTRLLDISRRPLKKVSVYRRQEISDPFEIFHRNSVKVK